MLDGQAFHTLWQQNMEWREEKSWFEHAPAWFAAIAALIYATGFLIEFTFLNSIGIRESGLELFKARYIYTGISCLLFPVTAAVVLIGGLHLLHRNTRRRKVVYRSSICLSLTLLFAFYLLILFTDSNFFREHELGIFLIFVPSIISLTFIRKCEDRRNLLKPLTISPPCTRRQRPSLTRRILLRKRWRREFFRLRSKGYFRKKWSLWLRYLFALAALIITVCTFYCLKSLAWEVLWTQGGWLYVAFLGTAGVFMWWIVRANVRGAMLLLGLCLPTALFYLSILTFAYRIYPFIPVVRGGRDYSRNSQTAVLVFNKDSGNSLPREIRDNSSAAISLDDIKEPVQLAEKLRGKSDDVSSYLWNRSSAYEQDIISSSVNSELEELKLKELKVVLAQVMNRVIESGEVIRQKLTAQPAQPAPHEMVILKMVVSKSQAERNNRIVLNSAYPTELAQPRFSKKRIISWPVTVLEETPNNIYISLETTVEDHLRWRRLGAENKPQKIFAISRNTVASISYRQ